MDQLLAGTPSIRKSGRGAAHIAAMLLLCSLVAPHAAPAQDPVPARTGDQAKDPGTQKKNPLAKLAEPWPDAERMHERRAAAENRRLFQTADPLAFTLTADFKAVNKDRDPNSTKRYPATLLVTDGAAKTDSIPVNLGTRGHFRLRLSSCSFVPLRVELPTEGAAATVFEGPGALKLVTHCQGYKEYEQYILREYLAYRIFNLFTPHSFRARLAKGTYVDSATGKPLTTRYAMFLEDDDDVARRVHGRIVDIPRALFKDLDSEALTLMALFEYMIANTDFSIYALHNIRLVQDQARVLHTVPYDLDMSGLVHALYAIPDPKLGIKTVRDRLYRGPCRSEDELEPFLETFRAKKGEVMALYDSLPDLGAAYRREAKAYLQEFYSTISRKSSVKRVLVDGCSRGSGM